MKTKVSEWVHGGAEALKVAEAPWFSVIEGDPKPGIVANRWLWLQPGGWGRSWFWAGVALISFFLAYAHPWTAPAVLVYLYGLIRLREASTWRRAFYPGLVVGLGISAVHLQFFWTIFSGGALVLWLVYSVWLGLFAVLARGAFRHLSRWSSGAMLPFLWVGIEFFRGELYYLRFSWLTPAMAFSGGPDQVLLGVLGIYGSAFLLAGVASIAANQKLLTGTLILLLCMTGMAWRGKFAPGLGMDEPPARTVRVAGVQMEFPTEREVLIRLREIIERHPDADLVVLSEYTFNGPVPEIVKAWCRDNRRYLVVGATDPLADGKYYNTAFVIGPSGQIEFRQVKAVPIQFFKDGLPAPEQRPWPSPWGPIGICICYDLSYTRATDPLVGGGAEALIVPTMDVADWGVAQHELHGRVAPLRAAEYGLPIFRLASSGISQAVDARGRQLGRTQVPGDGAVLTQTLELRGPGRVPPDRLLAWASLLLTALAGCGLTAARLAEKLAHATFLRKSDGAGGVIL